MWICGVTYNIGLKWRWFIYDQIAVVGYVESDGGNVFKYLFHMLTCSSSHTLGDISFDDGIWN